MRIVFFGTAEFAVPVLQAVFASRHEIAAVTANPDRARGRGMRVLPPPVKQEALRMGLPVHQPERLDGDFLRVLTGLAPSAALVAAYGKLISDAFLDAVPGGFLNVHPSLLPRHRGPSPIQQAILDGDRETGVSIIRLTAEMDAGPILLQQKVRIRHGETAGELHDRLAELGGKLAVRALDLVERGKAVFTEQDHSRATYTRKFSKEDARIEWSRSAEEVARHVRAMTPRPGAFTFTEREGRLLKISEVEPAGDAAAGDAAPGTVVKASDKEGIFVAVADGAVRIVRLSPAGSRRMTSQEFVRGAALEEGDRLVSRLSREGSPPA